MYLYVKAIIPNANWASTKFYHSKLKFQTLAIII